MLDSTMLNYYEILQVPPQADTQTIKAAYHTLMFNLRCHPDLGGTLELARQINEAYNTLKDPKKRAAYNKTLNPDFFKQPTKKGSYPDRRAIPRVRVRIPAEYKMGNAPFKKAMILDISYLGCRLQTQEPIDRQTKITIKVQGIIIEGIVKWKRIFHPSTFQQIHECGIKFLRGFNELDRLQFTY